MTNNCLPAIIVAQYSFFCNIFQERESMNSKLKAGIFTTGFGAVCVAVAFALQYLATTMTQEQFVIGLAVMGITACLYTIYSVLLSHFQYKDHLKSQVDKKSPI